jgi:chaperonin GroEL
MHNVAYTKIERGLDVQKKLIKGAIKLAEAVVDTLGPNGYTVIIDRPNGDPIVTQDGVTVARHIKLGNAVENQGAQIMKQGANRAQSQSGDGTTTATLLAMAILKKVLDLGHSVNASLVKEGMTAAMNDLVQFLNADALLVDLDSESGIEMLEKVAFISSNNDSMISSLIHRAVVHSKGRNPIKINKARGNECYVESLEGMIFYNSVHHDYFLEQLGVTNEVVFEKARIFVTDHDIVSLADISHVIEHAFRLAENQETRFPLIIIAPEFSQKALHVLFQNLSQFKELKVIALKAPEFGIQQSYCLHDIAIYTGGRAILKSEFEHLQDMQDVDPEEILGTSKMEIKRDQYAIINGRYDAEALKQRIDYLDKLIEEEESGYMQDKLMQRKAKLMGSISIIFVGAETPVEADEIHDRVDDAVNAVKGAIAEGVVKGGGVALMESVIKLNKLRNNDNVHLQKHEDFLSGYKMVLAAAMEPFFKIVINAEKDTEEHYDVLFNSGFKKMINIRTGKIVDIFEEKILDPKKITVNALKSAVSISSTLMSTRTSITGYVGESEE